jgi:hypothetical protein
MSIDKIYEKQMCSFPRPGSELLELVKRLDAVLEFPQIVEVTIKTATGDLIFHK